jgi:acyl carrier protein
VGDCLRASAHATGTALALLGLALHTGGRLVLWDQAPDGATLVADLQRERTGLVFADANTWADALQARRGASLSVIAAVDARDNSPELVAQLLDAGLSVLNVLQTDSLPLPLAAHWVADAAEAGLVGRPLVPHTVRVAPRPEGTAPIGVAAPVWVKTGAAGAWTASHTSARWRSDGVLQHVSDANEPTVLLGGGLVDLEALEQAALALPGVDVAAAQAAVDSNGRRRLVIGLQASGLSAAQRESHARALLDAVPTEARAALDLRWFEQIVRHPSGRLQLAQSRALKAQASQTGDRFAGTATEQAIHAVWSELLGMSHIGRNDNFFDLGGTSLTAMQAVLKLEQQIGKQISPRRYVSETLAQLAVAYDATGAAQPAAAPAEAAEPAPGLMKRLARLVQRA